MHGHYCYTVQRSNNKTAVSAVTEAPPVPSVLICTNLPPDRKQDVVRGVHLQCPLVSGQELLFPLQHGVCRLGGSLPPLHLPAPLCSHLVHELRNLLQDPLAPGGIIPSPSIFCGSASSSTDKTVHLLVLFVALVLGGWGCGIRGGNSGGAGFPTLIGLLGLAKQGRH